MIAYADAPVPVGAPTGALTPDGPTGYGATGLAWMGELLEAGTAGAEEAGTAGALAGELLEAGPAGAEEAWPADTVTVE